MRWRSRVSICGRSMSEASIMVRLRIPFHRFDHERGCVFRREARGIFRHAPQQVWMLDKFPDLMRQSFGGQFGLLEEDRRPNARENFRVLGLMIFGGVGKWYQDRWERERGELSQTGRARSAQGEIRGTVDFL